MIGVSLPGTERLVQLGGEGCPEVAEFAPAELGPVLAMSPAAAAVLIGDALDLRHRLRRLWTRVRSGEVPAWIGRRVAQTTRRYPAHVAAAVDARVAPWAGRLTWGRLEPVVRAAIAEADAELARAEADEAARQVGVFRGRSDDHGIITTVLRNEAPDAIGFDASIGRVAAALALLGDTRELDVRRAAAVGILANPQHTLELFDQVALVASAGPEAAARLLGEDVPRDADAPDTPPDPRLDGSQPGGDNRRDSGQCPACFGEMGRRAGSADPRPPAMLYVHVTDEALRARTGVARLEDVGPVLLDQVRRWLGNSRVTVRPVLDVAGMAPVDGYEVPDRMREALHLRTPADVFPYATNITRGKDVDHTLPWRPDTDPGPPNPGPPHHTGLDNLGPLTRRHHRVKTHGGWQLRQPFPGIFVWRSPHGRYYLV
ncbi:MAG: hypothetical protein ACRDO2_06045, partial [Nocardioidaceae bacterium]